MKIKIERRKRKFEKADVVFPIYAYVEYETETCYVKLEENIFTQIIVKDISIEIMKWKSDNKIVPEIWWDNQCSKENWEKQLEFTKEFISEF